MWRMALVATLAAAVYFIVPLAAPAGPSPDDESFGSPWTLETLAAALTGSGLDVQLSPPQLVDLVPEDVLTSGVIEIGTIDGYQVMLLVYKHTIDRRLVWPDGPASPIVFAANYGRIPEDHAWALDNAVLYLSTGGQYEHFGFVQERVLSLAG